MLRLLVIFAVIVVVFRFVRGMLRNQMSGSQHSSRSQGGFARGGQHSAHQATLGVETLVACSVCGTYFNPAQGQKIGEKSYCNAKCASLKS